MEAVWRLDVLRQSTAPARRRSGNTRRLRGPDRDVLLLVQGLARPRLRDLQGPRGSLQQSLHTEICLAQQCRAPLVEAYSALVEGQRALQRQSALLELGETDPALLAEVEAEAAKLAKLIAEGFPITVRSPSFRTQTVLLKIWMASLSPHKRMTP